ncbi:MAG: sulfite oxidase-like oxidoreductase [Nitrospirae bacterium]|jgi:DMSO/TMAO reductase YedYZ molybdopterin-dependent catalytic subunit|nr:sulfite oxidase-like oxidoreductase [Nitrospirota bacterium]
MDKNERLIKTKTNWAQHRRSISCREVDDFDTGDERLPPGQHMVNNWPVLDTGYKPVIQLEEWTLTIDGLVEHPLTLSWQEFQDQPQTPSTSDFHCVTSWSQFDNEWEGWSFQHLLQLVQPTPSAKFILFSAYDDYTTNLPLHVCDDEDVFLVTQWRGKPLSRDHGGPVRMIIPKRYAWKGAKWVKQITFLEKDQKGFWEVRGYSNTALPWENDRYA